MNMYIKNKVMIVVIVHERNGNSSVDFLFKIRLRKDRTEKTSCNL